MNKSRISPDTTAKMMKSDSQDTKTQRKMQEHTMSKNKNACFSCGLCQGSAGSIFESITEARNHVQTVHEIAEESVVDKLIKLPTTNFLKSYKCIACPGNAGNLIGVSEETLKTHFKEKHKTNTIKPFLLKRNCRICGFDKAPNDSELVKHFENDHPKSDFWADDEEEPDQDEEAYEPVDDSKYESNYRGSYEMAWTMNQVKKTELLLLTVIKKTPREGKSCLKNPQLLESQKRERNLYLDQV